MRIITTKARGSGEIVKRIYTFERTSTKRPSSCPNESCNGRSRSSPNNSCLSPTPFSFPQQTPAPVDPVFSPDSLSIAFYAQDNTIKKIAVSGGAAVTICPADVPFGLRRNTDGIVFGQGSKGIMRVSENGGRPEVRRGSARRSTL